MCDKCEKGMETEQDKFAKSEFPNIKEEQKEVSIEDLMGSMTIPPLELDITNLDGIQYDNEDFAKGIKEMSLVAGKITALLNVGLTQAQAIDYLINSDTILHNLTLAKVNNKATVEISKNTITQFEKQQL